MGSSQSTEAQPEVLGDVVRHDDLKKEMEEIIKSNGVKEAHVQIKELLEKWKKIPVNVCLLGRRGVGKSSFINNVIGRKAARVGVRETTTDADKFVHPDNESLCFWDMPGYGAKKYKEISQFACAMDITRFDIILFFHKGTFSTNDFKLYTEINKIGKKPLIIRTFFDVDSQDATTEGEYSEIRDDILSEISGYDLPVVQASNNVRNTNEQLKCYFISNRSHDFDYTILIDDILKELKSSEKKDAFTFNLSNRSKAFLEIKRKRLETRVLAISALCSANGLIPIPGVDAALNFGILLNEIQTMARVLGVNDILKVKSKSETRKRCAEYLTKQGLINLAKTISIAFAVVLVDDALKLIPVIGTVIGGMISSSANFVLARMTLNKVLEEFISVCHEYLELENQNINNDDHHGDDDDVDEGYGEEKEVIEKEENLMEQINVETGNQADAISEVSIDDKDMQLLSLNGDF